jgi:hypothetical protein
MNLAVALRQPAFEALTIIPFHLPLALAGVEPWIYVSCYALDLIYQFWVHTELTRSHPALEWVLNTPSAHRVHHGINAQYLDKNYGGILLVWDRLFGTYEPEVEPPVYGVTHPLASYNPVWANLSPFADIARKAREAPSGKLGVWFAHPGRNAGPASLVRRDAWQKYDPRVSARVSGYVFAHFVLLALGGGAFLSFAETQPRVSIAIPGAILLVSTLSLAAWTERRPWALGVDLARQAATVAVVAFMFASLASLSLASVVAAALLVTYVLLLAAFRPASAA